MEHQQPHRTVRLGVLRGSVDGESLRVRHQMSSEGPFPYPKHACHDAGIRSARVPNVMLFVRNPTGVSHSPDEFAEADDCNIGAQSLADVMADWVAG